MLCQPNLLEDTPLILLLISETNSLNSTAYIYAGSDLESALQVDQLTLMFEFSKENFNSRYDKWPIKIISMLICFKIIFALQKYITDPVQATIYTTQD